MSVILEQINKAERRLDFDIAARAVARIKICQARDRLFGWGNGFLIT